MTAKQKFELIDWSERHPAETGRQIAIRQSTVCLCGKPKEIGVMSCSACEARAA